MACILMDQHADFLIDVIHEMYDPQMPEYLQELEFGLPDFPELEDGSGEWDELD
jgi:hypothetical protein